MCERMTRAIDVTLLVVGAVAFLVLTFTAPIMHWFGG